VCTGQREEGLIECVPSMINLLKEKEWDPQKRRSATVEGVSMDEHGTEGVRLRVHVEVLLRDNHRCGMVI